MKTLKKLLAVCMAAMLLMAPVSLQGAPTLAAGALEKGATPLGILYTLDGDGVLTILDVSREFADGIDGNELRDIHGVTSVVFAEGVIYVPYGFFEYLPDLDSVTLADSVSLLGQSSLSGCTTKRLHIGKGLCEIGEEALDGVHVTESITVAPGNPYYHAAGNCLIETATKTLLLYCDNGEIPADGSVTRIAGSAFSYSAPTAGFSVPDCVTRIDASLRHGEWFDAQPDGVVYAGKVAVGYKGDMPENTDLVLQSGCVGIADSAFYNCINLRSVTIPQGVTYIGNKAFSNCANLVSVSIPDSVTSIGHNESGFWDSVNPFYATPWYTAQPDGVVYAGKTALCWKGAAPQDCALTLRGDCVGIAARAFDDCDWLTGTLTIPDGVIEIGDRAFVSCPGLTGLSLGGGLRRIGDDAFSYCRGLSGSLTIPNGVIEIGDGAFDSCSGLTGLSLGSGLKRIGDYAFDDCGGLNGSLTIPNGVTHIGNRAFYSCEGLTRVTVSNSVTCLGYSAFSGCKGLTDVSLGSGLTFIGWSAFQRCPLRNITIPRSVVHIGQSAFAECSLNRITVESGSAAYRSAGNCLIDTASKTLLAGCANSTIPNDGSVDEIGEMAFAGCGLTAVTMPNSLRKIGSSAFCDCGSLTKVTLNEGLRFINEMAFTNTGITEITLPESLEAVGLFALLCPGLKAIEIPRGVFYLAPAFAATGDITVSPDNPYYYSVNNCVIKTDEQKLVIMSRDNSVLPTDGSLKRIGMLAFAAAAAAGSDTGVEITIPDGVTVLEPFSLVTGTAVRIPTSVTYISTNASESGLTDIYYAGTEAQWQQIRAFRGWSERNESGYYYKHLQEDYYGDAPQMHFNAHWHTWTVTGETPATCAAAGERTFVCACGETKTEPIPATGNHTAGLPEETVISNPTCTAAGSKRTVVRCTVCGAVLSDKTSKLPANGHRYTVKVSVKEATCTGSGYTVYQCENCGDTEVRDRTSALGHDFQNGVCTRCGASESDDSKSPSFFERLLAFFRQIAEFFRKLFRR